ncbi:DNA primase [Thermovenabulum gondwanense]|uniref:DNA primase n=1 Tax=Thermovenabulum gondwanense TaxID=520767 RepID=A0A162MBT4_9FIRM|nr:DNA primase [Thermovenabulum gondwanense]KYO65179.1 DNA primase [Thermovenabulum gondwanense]
MGLFSEDIIREIQSRVDIVDLIADYVKLKKSGENYVALCPFHSEKTPSFTVSPKKQLFYCFGCGTGGNVFTFIMKKENLNFPEAVRFLAEKYGLEIREYDDAISDSFRLKREIYNINKIAADFYTDVLHNKYEGEKAKDYLKSRGIVIQTIEEFSLGYAPSNWDSLYNFLVKKGIPPELIFQAGLIIAGRVKGSYFDRFRDRIIFPIKDIYGHIVGFGGRVIGEGEPKYLNSPDTPVFSKGSILYGLDKIKKEEGNGILLVEGYMDVISLFQSGFKRAVASLGTSLTETQAKLLKKYTDEVIIAYDMDLAGRNATMRGLEILKKEGLNIRILTLPEGKDPDEFIQRYGRDEFQKELHNSKSIIDYLIKMEAEKLDLNNSTNRLKFIKKAVQILSEIVDEVERNFYIDKLYKDYEIPKNILIKALTGKNTGNIPEIGLKYKNSQFRNNNKELLRKHSPVKSLNDSIYMAEREFLKILLNDPENCKKGAIKLLPIYFLYKNHREIFNVIMDLVKNGEVLSREKIFLAISDKQEIASEMAKLLMESESVQKEENIEKLVLKIKKNYLRFAMKQLKERIKKAETIGEYNKVLNLLNYYQKLRKEMELLNDKFTEKGGM